MSKLKNKSEINRMAADILQKNNCYPSVVHCSYYSCVQLMKHIFLFTIGKSEADLRLECTNNKEGSHEVIINNILTHLKNTNKDWRSFSTNILQLKKLRTIADYDDVQIDSQKSSSSISLSDDVLSHLNSNIRI